jgi:hypothetical protein
MLGRFVVCEQVLPVVMLVALIATVRFLFIMPSFVVEPIGRIGKLLLTAFEVTLVKAN